MGFLDFLKTAGAELFGGGKPTGGEADGIRELVTRDLGTKIEDLRVTYDAGAVTLSGRADSQDTKEKAMLLAGNVKGVEKVDADGVTVTSSAPEQRVTYYTVEKGDNLSKIAKEQYGDAARHVDIFEANREVIKDPDLIYPGQKLRIPDMKAA